jgi:hypothetical protein
VSQIILKGRNPSINIPENIVLEKLVSINLLFDDEEEQEDIEELLKKQGQVKTGSLHIATNFHENL